MRVNSKKIAILNSKRDSKLFICKNKLMFLKGLFMEASQEYSKQSGNDVCNNLAEMVNFVYRYTLL